VSARSGEGGWRRLRHRGSDTATAGSTVPPIPPLCSNQAMPDFDPNHGTVLGCHRHSHTRVSAPAGPRDVQTGTFGKGRRRTKERGEEKIKEREGGRESQGAAAGLTLRPVLADTRRRTSHAPSPQGPWCRGCQQSHGTAFVPALRAGGHASVPHRGRASRNGAVSPGPACQPTEPAAHAAGATEEAWRRP
jgi:hypothetical protein